MKKLLNNKRGDFPSYLILIVVIFSIGIFFLFMNSLVGSIYTGFDEALSDDLDYNNSVAQEVLTESSNQLSSTYDFAFLGVFMAYLISLIITSYFTPTNIIFLFLYVILIMFGLLVGVLFANLWEGATEETILSVSASQLPITNFILGNFFPIIITIIGVTMIIIFFGKEGIISQ